LSRWTYRKYSLGQLLSYCLNSQGPISWRQLGLIGRVWGGTSSGLF